MTTVDTLLEQGNWPAAINAWGVAPARQDAIRNAITSWLAQHHQTPRSVTPRPSPYQSGLRERRTVLVPTDDTVDISLLLTFYLAGSTTPNVLVDYQSYSPARCQMNDGTCTCDELSQDEIDDGEECPGCNWGTEWCIGHHSYH
jgi:hypothetical protein